MSIAIDNPRIGEASHTSNNRAAYLCQTGQAVMVDGRLRIVRPVEPRHESAYKTVFYWNGDTGHFKMHRPGEVRS